MTVNELFDPYVTTRQKGTGLGLAIVRRVMDEHEGRVQLERRPEGGTSVLLELPRIKTDIRTSENETHESNSNTADA